MKTQSLIPSVRSLMETFFNDDVFNYGGFNTQVPVNIMENDENFQVQLSVPGAKKENFSIELENNTLRVKYEDKKENEEKKEEKGWTIHKKQFEAFSFERMFHLPETGVNKEKINAEYKDGILNIVIPKDSTPKLSKNISVN